MDNMKNVKPRRNGCRNKKDETIREEGKYLALGRIL
jgi:hypothetical protein